MWIAPFAAMVEDIRVFKKPELSSFHEKPIIDPRNPWALVFTALRDLLSRGQSETNRAAIDRSQKTDDSRTSEEDHDEKTSEELLHRFMEMVLLLNAHLFDEAEEFQR